MSTIDKKQISESLKEAMSKEDLHTRAVAKALNLNPCHISMCMNPNSWDSMGRAPWLRLEEWLQTRGKIMEFEIPAGEEIWKPKEKTAKVFTEKEVKKAEKSFREEMDVHEKAVVERNTQPKREAIYTKKYVDNLLSEKQILIDSLLSQLADRSGKNYALANDDIQHISHGVEGVRQKLSLDIEINLIINGQKVKL